LNNVLLANLLYVVEVYIGYASHNNDDIVRNIIARVGHFFFWKKILNIAFEMEEIAESRFYVKKADWIKKSGY